MIVDNDLIFANNQKLTAAKESTNMIDFEQVSPTGGMSGFLSAYFHVTGDVTGPSYAHGRYAPETDR